MMTRAHAALVKGLLARGDRQSDIAALLLVNAGRIAEISTGAKFGDVIAMAEDRLPEQDDHGRYLTFEWAIQQAARKELTFAALRQANIKRLPRFKNQKGELAHSQPDGSDWSLADWFVAVLGELGEAANVAKKWKRGDYPDDDMARDHLSNELADVQCYLDILTFRAGLDLGEITRDKFNIVSDRVDCPDIKL